MSSLHASIHHTVWAAAQQLRVAGVENPKREAQLLFCHAAGIADVTALIARSSDIADDQVCSRFQSLVDRRSQREPFAYITGRKDFFGFTFEVSSDVLIPRPDTELLVQETITTVLSVAERVKPVRLLDIGVGSGCVICSVAKLTGAVTELTGIDNSRGALSLAGKNAKNLGVLEKIQFLNSDLFGQISGRSFEVIVSNPPYIPAGQISALEPEVKRYEPASALDGGEDGLDVIRAILKDSPEALVAGGILLLEIGVGQAQEVCKIAEQNAFKVEGVFNDLGAIPRVVKLSKL